MRRRIEYRRSSVVKVRWAVTRRLGDRSR